MILANRTEICTVFLPCHLVLLVFLVLSQPESKKPTLVSFPAPPSLVGKGVGGLGSGMMDKVLKVLPIQQLSKVGGLHPFLIRQQHLEIQGELGHPTSQLCLSLS